MLTYNVLNDYVERMKKNDLAIVSTTNDIKTLTTDDINKLRAGDIVLKEDESGKHTYVVSYKKDGTGICLTYTDATYVETISYDYNSVTKEWTYNSMDATEIQPKLAAGDGISIENNVISATGGTSLYRHIIEYNDAYANGGYALIDCICDRDTAFTIGDLMSYLGTDKRVTASGILRHSASTINVRAVGSSNGTDRIIFYGDIGGTSYGAQSTIGTNHCTKFDDKFYQL